VCVAGCRCVPPLRAPSNCARLSHTVLCFRRASAPHVTASCAEAQARAGAAWGARRRLQGLSQHSTHKVCLPGHLVPTGDSRRIVQALLTNIVDAASQRARAATLGFTLLVLRWLEGLEQQQPPGVELLDLLMGIPLQGYAIGGVQWWKPNECKRLIRQLMVGTEAKGTKVIQVVEDLHDEVGPASSARKSFSSDCQCHSAAGVRLWVSSTCATRRTTWRTTLMGQF
jgi:hypothetical protein